jgi:Flp pilus assembly protein TadG
MTPRHTSGAVAIEFALVGLAFISLLLLAMETGWQLLIDSALGAGARAASPSFLRSRSVTS